MSNAKRRAANPPGVRLPRNERPRSMKASLLVAAAVTVSLAAQTPARPAPLPAPVRPVVDTYHGVQVIDSYRWLERWDDSEVKAWTAAQNTYTHAQLDALPFMAALRARVQDGWRRYASALDRRQIPPRTAVRDQAAAAQRAAVIVVMRSADDLATERIVVDPNGARSERQDDDRLLRAVARTGSASRSRSRRAAPRTATCTSSTSPPGGAARRDPARQRRHGRRQRRLERRRQRASTTRATRGRASAPGRTSTSIQQVYFHKLGTPTDDGHVRDRQGLSAHRRDRLAPSDDGRSLLADGREWRRRRVGALRCVDRRASWTQLAGFDRRVITARSGRDGALYLLSREGRAARQASCARPREAATLADGARCVVPEGEAIDPTRSRRPRRASTSTSSSADRRSCACSTRRQGAAARCRSPPSRPSRQIARARRRRRARSQAESYVTPAAWYRYVGGTGAPRRPRWRRPRPSTSATSRSCARRATSKDGTKVPLNILRRKGIALDGTNPTLLYGYGGYGISLDAAFSATRRVWLDQGGVFAVANLRGGGEFGEAWHGAGQPDARSKTCSTTSRRAREHLVDRQATRARHARRSWAAATAGC